MYLLQSFSPSLLLYLLSTTLKIVFFYLCNASWLPIHTLLPQLWWQAFVPQSVLCDPVWFYVSVSLSSGGLTDISCSEAQSMSEANKSSLTHDCTWASCHPFSCLVRFDVSSQSNLPMWEGPAATSSWVSNHLLSHLSLSCALLYELLLSFQCFLFPVSGRVSQSIQLYIQIHFIK